jgi:hypothetical protein
MAPQHDVDVVVVGAGIAGGLVVGRDLMRSGNGLSLFPTYTEGRNVHDFNGRLITYTGRASPAEPVGVGRHWLPVVAPRSPHPQPAPTR